MAPSVEIRLLQQARESAKAAAEVRRGRVKRWGCIHSLAPVTALQLCGSFLGVSSMIFSGKFCSLRPALCKVTQAIQLPVNPSNNSDLSRSAAFSVAPVRPAETPCSVRDIFPQPCSGVYNITSMLQASGSGRRARAPSRKLLEASGALENEGAQWMTREIKEADAKAKRELREQRKHFKAAGLKAGEAIEAITETKADGGETTADADIEGGKFDASWRVQTQAPAKQQQSMGEGLAASSNINAKKEAVEAFSPAAVGKPPLKRAWMVSVPDGSARDGKAAKVLVDATAPTPKRSKQDHDHHNREGGREAAPEASGNVSAGKPKTARGGGESKGSADADKGRDDSVDQTKCEFGDCSKTANFGVNGTVRYW